MQPASSTSSNSSPPGGSSEPSFLRSVVTPWVDLFAPRRAGAHFAAATPVSFWIGFGFCALSFAVFILLVSLWAGTTERSYVVTTPATSTQPAQWTTEVQEQSMGEVWRRWHRHGSFGPAELMLVSLPLGLVALAALGAWLHLPTVYRAGPVRLAFMRAFRGVAAGSGVLALMALVLGGLSVAVTRPPFGASQSTVALLMISYPAALCLLVCWVGQSVQGARGSDRAIELPQRCEGCGYDLTHRPSDGLCPECRLDLASSLTPDLRRPGCPWEDDKSDKHILATARDILFRPSAFYGHLKLRTPVDRAVTFARWNYGYIAGGAAAWMFIMLVMTAPRADAKIVWIPCAMFFLIPLVGWSVHRIIGALATSWWVACGLLADVGWARKVVAYEAAYLWTFCAYSGLLFSSFAVLDDASWITRLIGSEFFMRLLHIPAEPAVIILGNLALCVLWLWRYRLIIRAIRYSNF
ncbi:MAG: hypothetical protein GY778_30180 [bacterium]|nr:hypothetical protein [bacterium]